MNTVRKSIVIAIASLGLGGAAIAASNPAAAPAAGGCHWGAHGAHSAERAAKRQAALHDKLGLSTAQEAAWKTFTDKLQALAPTAPAAAPTAAATATTAPERADRMVTFLQTAQQRAVTRAQAVKEFYAVLSPEQQTIFDSQTQRHRHHSSRS